MWSITRVWLVLVIVVVGTGLGLVGCAPAEESSSEPAEEAPAEEAAGFAVGDSVAALWDDGNLYLADVTAVEGEDVTVTYVDDGSSKTVPASDVRPIPDMSFEVGDRVLAVWSSGRFYPGEVTAVNGSTYTVAWDDGSAPSDVEAGRIIEE